MFFHRFGQAISEKSSRMEYQFGDDFLLQDADPVGEKTNKGFWKTSWLRYSGKRRHRCIGKRRHRCAANEGKDVPANGRQTIIKGDIYSDTPSALFVLFPYCYMLVHPPPSLPPPHHPPPFQMQRQTARANDVKCSGKRQAKVAANGKTTQRQTEKKNWPGMSGTWCKSMENWRSLMNTPGQEGKRQKAIYKYIHINK